MTVTIQNHVYQQPCEPEPISTAELVAAAEQLDAAMSLEALIGAMREACRCARAVHDDVRDRCSFWLLNTVHMQRSSSPREERYI